MDDDKNGVVSQAEFLKYNRKFPVLLYPAFTMQMVMRKKILGVPFWDHQTIQTQRLFGSTGISVSSVLDDLDFEEKLSIREAERVSKNFSRTIGGKQVTNNENSRGSIVAKSRRAEKKKELEESERAKRRDKKNWSRLKSEATDVVRNASKLSAETLAKHNEQHANENKKKKRKSKKYGVVGRDSLDIYEDDESNKENGVTTSRRSSRSSLSSLPPSITLGEYKYENIQMFPDHNDDASKAHSKNKEDHIRSKENYTAEKQNDIRKQHRAFAEETVASRKAAMDRKFGRKSSFDPSAAADKARKNKHVVSYEEEIRIAGQYGRNIIDGQQVPNPPANDREEIRKPKPSSLAPRRPRPPNTPPNALSNVIAMV